MSNGDKRSVTTDALDTLGTLIDDKQKRDAIHLAVEPVISAGYLEPGTRVRIANGMAFEAEEPFRPEDDSWWHGIVDPFLAKRVEPGERFWFVMKPREVRSLRHVWSHPDFPDEVGAIKERAITKEDSEQWLRDFCRAASCPDFDTLMGLLQGKDTQFGEDRAVFSDDEYLFISGYDASGFIPGEFWVHAENYLGVKFPSHPAYFSCSC